MKVHRIIPLGPRAPGGGRRALELLAELIPCPLMVHSSRQANSGWGLFLVDRLADRWGQFPHDGVWVEKDLPA